MASRRLKSGLPAGGSDELLGLVHRDAPNAGARVIGRASRCAVALDQAVGRPFGSIDLIVDRCLTLRCRDLFDCRHGESVGSLMREIESLVEAYLIAEHQLEAPADGAGGAVPPPDGRVVTVGRAEFDALLGERRKRAWVIIRRNTPMPPRR